MEKQLKERIFGAVVIVSLMIIFVPMLLNPDEDETNILEDSLTLAPNIKSKEAELGIPESVLSIQAQTETLKNQPEAIELAKAPQKAQLKQETKNIDELEYLVSKIQKEQPKNHQLVKNSAEKAWVVQLATFADEKNAINLVKDLSRKGFSAYTREAHGQTQDFTRVLVGPAPNREQAEKLKSTLASAYKIEGMIIPFVS